MKRWVIPVCAAALVGAAVSIWLAVPQTATADHAEDAYLEFILCQVECDDKFNAWVEAITEHGSFVDAYLGCIGNESQLYESRADSVIELARSAAARGDTAQVTLYQMLLEDAGYRYAVKADRCNTLFLATAP